VGIECPRRHHHLEPPHLLQQLRTRAHARGLDRQGMADSLYFKQAVVANSSVPPVSWAYNKDAKPQYPHDPAKAESMLDAAGWKKGADGIRANAVNADRIRSGLLTEEMIASRSKVRGVSEADYMGGNLLGREVTADDVAQAFLHQALEYLHDRRQLLSQLGREFTACCFRLRGWLPFLNCHAHSFQKRKEDAKKHLTDSSPRSSSFPSTVVLPKSTRNATPFAE